ncbi:MAG: S1C family serine protease [Candidatus Dormibacteria bacterium]
MNQPGPRPPLLAAVLLSAVVGLVGGAASAWGIYHRLGTGPTGGSSGLTVGQGGGATADAVAADRLPSIVKVITQPLTAADLLGDPPGLATGFVVSADGLVVTSTHALRGATRLGIATADGHRYEALEVATDVPHGVAVLRAEGASDLAPLGFAAHAPHPGDLAIALGAPPFATVSVSSGTVGSVGRSLSETGGGTGSGLVDALTVEALADPRSDGAPVLDAAGAVIGVVSGGAHPGVPGMVAGSGRAAAALVDRAVHGTSDGHGSFGVEAVLLDPATAAAAGVPSGALVRSVDGGGPAASVLRQGDIVTAVNGAAVDAAHPLDPGSFGIDPGQPVQLSVMRAGAAVAVGLTVASG